MAKSVRLKKKLAKTGRTATWQPLGKKGLEAKKKEIMATPKPELPKEPKEDAAAKAAADEIAVREEIRLKEYLTNMITASDELTSSQKRQIADAIYNADEETLLEIKDIFMDDEGTWKDFYLYQNEAEAGYMDQLDYMAALQTVMDVLGVAY